MRDRMTTDLPEIGRLIAKAEDTDSSIDGVRQSVTDLLRLDAAVGVATALGILAREPRLKPSAGLLIDPGDTVLFRWRQRVAACGALLEDPAVIGVFDEIVDELSDDPEFAADVLASCRPDPALGPERRAALDALLRDDRVAD